MTPATTYMQVNTSAYSNVYLTLQEWHFHAISPYPSSHPGTAPIINNFSGNGKTDYMTNPINLTIN